MKNILIGGIGNVLLGDDAVGPYVIRLLESSYTFSNEVEVADLGTPALDLTHRIAGRDAVILVDCVVNNDPPGTLQIFRKAEILRTLPEHRLDPHSPALAECLLTADMLGASPDHVLLIGIVGASFEPGHSLTKPVTEAAENVVQVIVDELHRLGIASLKLEASREPRIWWSEPAPQWLDRMSRKSI